MRKFDTQAPETAQKGLELAPTTRDYFALFESQAEFSRYVTDNHGKSEKMIGYMPPDFCNVTGKDAARKLIDGDLSTVSQSDALLARFERFSFQTERKRWVDDIAGGFPNVPAYLSGHPLAMRRRINDASDAAPVAIVCDLTSSAEISVGELNRRGAAILALVRVLTMRRPVELWAGMITDAHKTHSLNIFFRIETTPLDLARAAFALTNAAVYRRLCAALAEQEYERRGFFAYGKFGHARPFMRDMIAPAFTHATDVLAVPSITSSDYTWQNPERWIEQKLAELAPAALDAA